MSDDKMKTKKNVFTIATIGILLISCFVITPIADDTQPGQPSGTTLYVGGYGPGNYSNIQDAIDDASDGYTVYVYDGIYYENIVVDKSINLIGENIKTTIIYGNGIGNVIEVIADYVNISGFTIRHPGPIDENLYYFGEVTYSLSGANYFNTLFSPEGSCKLTTCSVCVYQPDSTVITNEGIDIVVWDDVDGYPGTEYARINVPALNIKWYPEFTEVDFSTYDLIFTEDFHIGYCIVNDTVDFYAPLLDNGSLLINRSSYYAGQWYPLIDEDGIYNFLITANVTFSGVGVNLNQTNYSCLKNNRITRCNQGAVSQVLSSGEYKYQNNLIYNNNFINNTQNAYDSSINNWDNGTKGNYWDDYTGEDNDGDGIGDTPYNISGGTNQKDNYPLMEPVYEGYSNIFIDITIDQEYPENGTADVPIDQSKVGAFVTAYKVFGVSDPAKTLLIPFDWEIGGDNVSTNSSTEEDGQGFIEADIIGPLSYDTEYNWYVNVSAGGVYENVTFSFTTGEAPNQLPIANFTYFIRDLTVFVNASSSIDNDGNIASYSWNFSHGTNGTGKITNHTYAANGKYNVNLKVTDDKGATNSKIVSIEINNTAPVANFTYIFETNGKIVVKFDASKSEGKNETIVSYFWEFGDGKNGTGKTINHEYERDSKTYKVNLTVTDSSGLTNATSKLVPLPDMTNPTIKIDQPLKGLYVNGKFVRKFFIRPALIIGDITIKVNASDSGSGIKYVELWIGKDLKENKTTGTFDYVWTKDRIRLIHLFKIKVVAYDNEGNSATKTMFVKKYL